MAKDLGETIESSLTYNEHITQTVSNCMPRLVLGLRKYDHISEGLNSLKWLTIADKILLNDSIMVVLIQRAKLLNADLL